MLMSDVLVPVLVRQVVGCSAISLLERAWLEPANRVGVLLVDELDGVHGRRRALDHGLAHPVTRQRSSSPGETNIAYAPVPMKSRTRCGGWVGSGSGRNRTEEGWVVVEEVELSIVVVLRSSELGAATRRAVIQLRETDACHVKRVLNWTRSLEWSESRTVLFQF